MWSFKGESGYEGAIRGGLVQNEVAVVHFRRPVIAGGSDAPGVHELLGPEMAPKPPAFGTPWHSRGAPL